MKKDSEQYVMICPKCGSVDVRQDKNITQQIGIFPTVYVCGQCGQKGNIFPEIPISEVENYERQLQKLKTNFGSKK